MAKGFRLDLQAKEKVWRMTGYAPHVDSEAQPFHSSDFDWRALAGGERSGKSTAVGRGELAPYLCVPHADRAYEYHIVGNSYADTRHEFLYAFEDLERLGLILSARMPEHETQPLKQIWNCWKSCKSMSVSPLWSNTSRQRLSQLGNNGSGGRPGPSKHSASAA